MTTETMQPKAFTAEDLERAERYIAFTREMLYSIAQGLTEQQSHYRPAPGAWSITENLEHLVIVEGRVQERLLQMSNAEEGETGVDDDKVVRQTIDRSTKYQTPPPGMPSGTWNLPQGLIRFDEARAKTLDIVHRTPDLRGHVIQHPVLGPLDGIQWLFAMGAHCARHAQQMLEVKASPGYPTT